MTIVAANGTRICGRYTLLGKLGEGGEGEVWRARDHERGKEVALKILHADVARRPGAWESLEQEHETASGLDHPLILKIDAPVRDGDTIALPMELAPDGDLRRLCGVSYLEIVPVLIEVAQALAHAHERGVVHRDLKPSNVLFDSRGHVRLADFTGARGGLSPFTASPQQLRSEPPTTADDIYGLGALAYELLSGHPPRHPRLEPRRTLEEPAPPLKPAHLAPARLVKLVMSMLASRPSDRPASMSEVIEALDAGLNDTLPFAYEDACQPLPSSTDELPALAPSAPPRPPQTPPIPPRQAQPAPAPPRPAPVSSQPVLSQSALPKPAQAAPEPAPLPSIPPQPTSPQPVAAQSAAPPPPQPSPPPPLRAERAVPDPDLRALWADIKVERVPNLMKLEPVRRPQWPFALAAGILAVAVALFFILHGAPHDRSWASPSLTQLRAIAPPQVMKAVRGAVEAPLRAMASARGHAPGAAATTAGAPGAGSSSDANAATSGQSAAAAGSAAAPPEQPSGSSAEQAPAERADAERTAEDREGSARAPGGAASAGASTSAPSPVSPASRLNRLARAQTRAQRGPAASRAPTATTRSVSTAGARHAAASAPREAHAAPARSSAPSAIQALLHDAQQAESAREFSRAVQDYSQALALDGGNAAARAGLQRANAAFGEDEYAQAVGSGFAALGAGRLEEARTDFQRARGFDRTRTEAVRGLRRVNAALRVRDAAEARSRARADLESRLQALVDDPQRLGSPAVRAEAASLMREADATSSQSVVLKSLAQRLAILLPSYDKPVHLALVSDNVTQVAIPQIGAFGTFARRDIDLKPGRYTVIGTREGYREVRRDITVAPGEGVKTISIRCEVPI